MGKVILICGKICSGKSWYARDLKGKNPAVILSTDEVTYDLIFNEQGEFYNVFAQRVNGYLRKKAVEIVQAGANVILDWGFWTRKDREDISAFFDTHQIPYEWHYVDVSDEQWEKHIARRNQAVASGNGGSDFYVDEGLRQKVLSMFEVPKKEEMDIRYNPENE